ncbi:MAG: hypothetical protein GXX90_07490 [Microbacteriaceae bacterium]|nr:hypothetical protein [Microbacteriaceae bacterium]
MALNHPHDLDAWRRWQRGRHALRRLRDLTRRPAPPELHLHTLGEAAPRILVVLDATTPSAVGAYAAPIAHLAEPVAVLAPGDVREHLPVPAASAPEAMDADAGVGATAPRWRVRRVDAATGAASAGATSGANVTAEPPGPPAGLAEVRAMLAAGHFLPVSAIAHSWAGRLGARFAVAQHGLMTPFAPPLPEGAHLLAFGEADADFWRSGRDDVTSEVVGAQLLWRATQERLERERAGVAPVDPHARPVFLGQLHGAELARRRSAAAASAFCTTTGASYRPHPAERDALSRLQHRVWQRRGIEIDTDRRPLAELGRPVAAVFSTGVLEAAAAGIPAWATAVDPPEWVRDFWTRYDLREFTVERDRPTPPPAVPELEPARAIAAALERLVGGTA